MSDIRDLWDYISSEGKFVEQPYTLREIYQKLPRKQSDELVYMTNNENKTRPKNTQLTVPPMSAIMLDRLQEAMTYRGLNADESNKYFHPDTKVKLSRLSQYPNLGFVDRGIDPNLIHLNKFVVNGLSPSEAKDTVLHEASHVDSNRSPAQGYFLGHKVSPLADLYNRLRSLPTEQKKNYMEAGNVNDSVDEVRSNLRASLGRAPYGTTAAQHFKPLLDAAFASDKNSMWHDAGELPYAKKAAFGMQTKITPENVVKFLETDLFPRERWIESREPTTMEKLSDMFDTFKSKFR